MGCLFAWYLYYNFAVEPGQNVVIAAHSMGGIIVRVALTFTSLAFPQFPPTVGNISDVVTFGTPHGGATGLGNFSFLQARELATGSEFMKNMKERSKNPQAIGDLHIKTEWTVIGSAGDGVAMGVNSLDIDGVSHKVMYLGQTNIIKRNNVSETRQWRYDHGGYLHYKQGDLLINTDEWTYNQEVCDAPTPGSNACDLGNYDPHDPPSPPSWFQSKTLASPLHTMLLAFAPVVKNGEGVCTPTKRIC